MASPIGGGIETASFPTQRSMRLFLLLLCFYQEPPPQFSRARFYEGFVSRLSYLENVLAGLLREVNASVDGTVPHGSVPGGEV